MLKISFSDLLLRVPGFDLINPCIAEIIGSELIEFPEQYNGSKYGLCPMIDYYLHVSKSVPFAGFGELIAFSQDQRYLELKGKGEIFCLQQQIFVEDKLYYPSLAWFQDKRWLGLTRGSKHVMCSLTSWILVRC